MRISDWSSDVCSSDLGYAHTNHAPAGAQKCELVDPALRPAVLNELARGRETLAALFGPRSLPALVPPWNRIDAAWAERLPGCGLAALIPGSRRGGTGCVCTSRSRVVEYHYKSTKEK